MEGYIPKLSEPALRWVRFLALVTAVGLLCWFCYWLRGVFTPLLIGLAIAYVLNPVVTWFENRQRVSRMTTVVVAFSFLAAGLLSGGLYAGASTMAQIQRFSNRLPVYRVRVEQFLSEVQARQEAESVVESPSVASAPAEPPTSAPTSQFVAPPVEPWWRDFMPMVEQHGATVARSIITYVLDATSSVFALCSLLVLCPMYTFFFLLHFNDMVKWVRDHLPAAYREPIVHAVKTIDAAMANFFRGRLIVCMLVGACTGIGWSLVPGQNYALPLGILAGVLNLVPFMSLAALPVALIFTYLGATDANISWAVPLALTTGVYMAVQALESFVFSPLVEGKASGLHPLAIVVALLIGAEIAGLLGMLLAIPVASTLKTFAVEWILPEIRRLAGQEPTATAEPDQDLG